MNEIIDLVGSTGRPYRFRRVSLPAFLPVMSGNFVFVRWQGDKAEVVCSGTADSLIYAAGGWADATRHHGAHSIYVRLNVSRTVRIAEHDDLAVRHNPPILAPEGLGSISRVG